jgi:hypothetical protein
MRDGWGAIPLIIRVSPLHGVSFKTLSWVRVTVRRLTLGVLKPLVIPVSLRNFLYLGCRRVKLGFKKVAGLALKGMTQSSSIVLGSKTRCTQTEAPTTSSVRNYSATKRYMREVTGKCFGAIVVALALALLISLTYSNYTIDTLPFLDDVAISFAVGKSVLEGQLPLIGQPSHLGGRHFGPLYYYVTAVALSFAKEDVLTTMAIFAGLKLFGVALAALLAYQIAPALGACAAAASITLVAVGPMLSIIRLPWVNHFLILPSALFFLALFFAIRVGPRALPLLLAAATVVVQTFYGAVPLVGMCIVATIVTWIVCRYELRAAYNGRAQIVILGVFLLLWIPPIVFEFVYAHNMLRMVSKHFVSPPHTLGLTSAIGNFRSFIDFYALHQLIPESRWGMVGTIGIVLVALDYIRSIKREARRFWGVVLCGVGAYIVALSRVTPPFYLFYLYSILPVLCVFMGGVIGHAAALVIRATAIRSYRTIAGGAVGILVLVLAAARVHEALPSQRGHLSTLPLPPFSSIRHAQEVASVVNSVRGDERSVRLFMRGDAKHRMNGAYWYLGPASFQRMAYAGFFKELDLFSRGPRSEGSLGFLIYCHSDENVPSKRKAFTQLERNWIVGDLVSLASCTTCGGCEARTLTPRVAR